MTNSVILILRKLYIRCRKLCLETFVLPNKVPEMRGCIAFEPGQTSPFSKSQPRGTIYFPLI